MGFCTLLINFKLFFTNLNAFPCMICLVKFNLRHCAYCNDDDKVFYKNNFSIRLRLVRNIMQCIITSFITACKHYLLAFVLQWRGLQILFLPTWKTFDIFSLIQWFLKHWPWPKHGPQIVEKRVSVRWIKSVQTIFSFFNLLQFRHNWTFAS